MNRNSSITGNSSRAVERHLGSSYQTVLHVSKKLPWLEEFLDAVESTLGGYLGVYEEHPLEMPDGAPLVVGSFYVNSVDTHIYFYVGEGEWTSVYDQTQAGIIELNDALTADLAILEQEVSTHLTTLSNATGNHVNTLDTTSATHIATMNGILTSVQNFATQADASAQLAGTHATSAQQSSNTASGHASDASGSASAALSHKQSAESSAYTATLEAQNSATSANTSTAASVVATDAANRAETAAGDAEASKQAAETSEINAETSATEAASDASTAATKAAEALTSANTATTKASQTEQDALNTEAYKLDAESAATSASLSDASASSHAQQTALDAAQTAQDVVSTAQDVAQTSIDKAATHADAQQTALDKATVAQDKASAEAAAQTATDKAVQTTADAIATAADRVATGQDKSATDLAVIDTNQYKLDAQGFSQAASTSATDAETWAEAARRAANETFVSGGTFTPTADEEYPDYIGVERDTSWIVRFDDAQASYTYQAGPLTGETVWNGDQVFLDVPGNTLVVIPNPSAAGVLTVNGESGTSITLTASHIPYGNSDVSTTLDTVQVTLNSNSTAIATNTSAILGHTTRIDDLETTVTGKLNAGDTAVNAAKLGDELPSYYATASSLTALSDIVANKLDIDATAANASNLGNQPPSYYATASALTALSGTVSNKLDADATASNAEKLDGQLPAYYAKQSDLDIANQTLLDCLLKSSKATLTTNDGFGDANEVHNHTNGTPQQSGSSYRWAYSTDSTTAVASFQMKSATVAGVPVTLTNILEVSESSFKSLVTLKDKNDLEVTGVVSTYAGSDSEETIVRTSQRTIKTLVGSSHTITLDEASFSSGDEIVFYTVGESTVLSVTTNAGNFWFPDEATDTSFTFTGQGAITLVARDASMPGFFVTSVST